MALNININVKNSELIDRNKIEATANRQVALVDKEEQKNTEARAEDAKQTELEKRGQNPDGSAIKRSNTRIEPIQEEVSANRPAYPFLLIINMDSIKDVNYTIKIYSPDLERSLSMPGIYESSADEYEVYAWFPNRQNIPSFFSTKIGKEIKKTYEENSQELQYKKASTLIAQDKPDDEPFKYKLGKEFTITFEPASANFPEGLYSKFLVYHGISDKTFSQFLLHGYPGEPFEVDIEWGIKGTIPREYFFGPRYEAVVFTTTHPYLLQEDKYYLIDDDEEKGPVSDGSILQPDRYYYYPDRHYYYVENYDWDIQAGGGFGRTTLSTGGGPLGSNALIVETGINVFNYSGIFLFARGPLGYYGSPSVTCEFFIKANSQCDHLEITFDAAFEVVLYSYGDSYMSYRPLDIDRKESLSFVPSDFQQWTHIALVRSYSATYDESGNAIEERNEFSFYISGQRYFFLAEDIDEFVGLPDFYIESNTGTAAISISSVRLTEDALYTSPSFEPPGSIK